MLYSRSHCQVSSRYKMRPKLHQKSPYTPASQISESNTYDNAIAFSYNVYINRILSPYSPHMSAFRLFLSLPHRGMSSHRLFLLSTRFLPQFLCIPPHKSFLCWYSKNVLPPFLYSLSSLRLFVFLPHVLTPSVCIPPTCPQSVCLYSSHMSSLRLFVFIPHVLSPSVCIPPTCPPSVCLYSPHLPSLPPSLFLTSVPPSGWHIFETQLMWV